ncbi:MAG TPA: pentapeptide repeat-containing protein [Longimicrobium sp.]
MIADPHVEPDQVKDEAIVEGDPSVIDNDKAKSRLEKHRAWLASRGKEGTRASFRNAVCSGVTFSGSLAQADFHGATLEGCAFAPETDLTEADFSEANLTAVDLSQTLNLAEHRLGVSKLSYAKMPPYVKFEGLASVKDISARAERILFALMASCATVIVLTRVISHTQLFQPSQAITLPVLGLPVPVRTFFNLAPWLLLIPYIYLLSTLAKLWSTLRDLPAILPNHRLLFREVPSSPNFCVLPFGWCWRSFPRDGTEQQEARQLARLTRTDRWLVIFAVWWLVPLTIAWLWFSYLPRHSAADTRIQVLAVALAVAVSVGSYGQALAHLTRGCRDWTLPVNVKIPWPLKRSVSVRTFEVLLREEPAPGSAAAVIPRRLRHRTVAACAAGVVLVLGLISHRALRDWSCEDEVGRRQGQRGACYWLAANLKDARLDSLSFINQNLRRAFMPGAKLEGAKLEDVRMQGAQMSDVDAKGAKMKDARLQYAVLWEATLEKAELKEARMTGADLRGASLLGAELQGAQLQGADLRGANLSNAIVCGAEFESSFERDAARRAGAVGTEFSVSSSSGYRAENAPLIMIPPAFLSDKSDQREFRRWANAEDGAESLADDVIRQAPSGWLNRAELQRRAARIDVSMAASTQRIQLGLVQFLHEYARRTSRDRVPYTPELRERVGAFIDAVQRKARNHCVLPALIPLPPTRSTALAGQSGRVRPPAFSTR